MVNPPRTMKFGQDIQVWLQDETNSSKCVVHTVALDVYFDNLPLASGAAEERARGCSVTRIRFE